MEEVDIRKIFGENVKQYRKSKGLSQEQLAEKLDISPNHLSVIETGGKFVTYKLLEKIIRELEVMPSTLFYTNGTAKADKSVSNRINIIISDEMQKTVEVIQKKIAGEFLAVYTK